MSGCSRWDGDDPTDKEVKENRKQIAAAKKSIMDFVSAFLESGYAGQELRLVIEEHYPDKKVAIFTNTPNRRVEIPKEL